ncbi:hypothetical protein ACIHFD_49080 [Nonomuraea sp. NPDC051941]|uniref:hypothetical protein n=1 Tax=Nonomuraea sp. NPDC051941 TaxID=3364373 RepID=UPI0037CB01A4
MTEPGPDPEEGMIGLGELREEWCPVCRQNTASAADIHLFDAEGGHRVGMLVMCGECGWSPFTTPGTSWPPGL